MQAKRWLALSRTPAEKHRAEQLVARLAAPPGAAPAPGPLVARGRELSVLARRTARGRRRALGQHQNGRARGQYREDLGHAISSRLIPR